MRRSLFVLPFLTLLAACIADVPDIDVVTRHDMGTIHKGQVATTSIVVRNTGRAPLVVQSASTSCGCTTAILSPETIPAGGKGLLRVSYDSNAHPKDLGRIKRFVFLATNDPDESDVRITLTVDVTAP